MSGMSRCVLLFHLRLVVYWGVGSVVICCKREAYVTWVGGKAGCIRAERPGGGVWGRVSSICPGPISEGKGRRDTPGYTKDNISQQR